MLIVPNGWKTGDAKSKALVQEQSVLRKFKACVTVFLMLLSTGEAARASWS